MNLKIIRHVISGLAVASYINAKAEVIITAQPSEFIGNYSAINYDLSKQDADKIIAFYTQQHKLDSAQIKALSTAIAALQNKTVIASETQIKTAMQALEQGNPIPAKQLLKQETQRVELSFTQIAQAQRNLGSLAMLDNPQEALSAYRRATEIDPDNLDGWNLYAALLQRIGESNQAIAAYQTMLSMALHNQNQEIITWAYSNLGNAYYIRGELSKAIEMYQKSLAIIETVGDKEKLAAAYGNMGFIYDAHGELDKALAMYYKALQINEMLNKKDNMAQNYGNLGLAYYKRGEVDKSIEMYQKSLQLNEALDRKEGMAINYNNLASAYKAKARSAEARLYYQKSIEVFKQLGSPNVNRVQSWLDALH